jgi:hypothetical protein
VQPKVSVQVGGCILVAALACNESDSSHVSSASPTSSAVGVNTAVSGPDPTQPESVARDTAPRPATHAFHQELPDAALRSNPPALRYARLSARACRAELRRRKLPASAARGRASGVVSPLRLEGPLQGVRFKLPRSVYGILDCRLVLMLDDMAGELASLGVVAVQVSNVYRPRAKLPPKTERGQARLSQHAHALAIDIIGFELADGPGLNLERDWHGAIGAPVCGPESSVTHDMPAGVTLRNLTCAIARAGYCNHLLTPNHDEAHVNHLHCDIKPESSELDVK